MGRLYYPSDPTYPYLNLESKDLQLDPNLLPGAISSFFFVSELWLRNIADEKPALTEKELQTVVDVEWLGPKNGQPWLPWFISIQPSGTDDPYRQAKIAPDRFHQWQQQGVFEKEELYQWRRSLLIVRNELLLNQLRHIIPRVKHNPKEVKQNAKEHATTSTKLEVEKYIHAAQLSMGHLLEVHSQLIEGHFNARHKGLHNDYTQKLAVFREAHKSTADPQWKKTITTRDEAYKHMQACHIPWI